MGTWITPVADRAAQDVAYAATLAGKYNRAGFAEFTPAEKADWDAGLKGCLNVTDYARIYNNQEYVRDLMQAVLGGLTSLAPNTLTSTTAIPYVSAINTIERNLDALIRIIGRNPAGYVTKTWVPGANDRPDYNDANRWEQDLDILKRIVESMSERILRCGTLGAGGDRTRQLIRTVNNPYV